MERNHYTVTKTFKIYAILLPAEENFCFVGKTTGRRLSAVYHRHRRGEVTATEGFLSQKDEYPQLYLLEELSLSSAQAYKRVLAWIHIFLNNGYAVINHNRSVVQARNLKPDTAHMVEELKKEPLENVLQRTLVRKPTDADAKPELQHLAQEKEETATFNVRLKASEKQLFLNFCKKRKLTQKQGFSILLDYADSSADTKHLQGILKQKDARIRELELYNEKIKAKKVTKGTQEYLKEYSSFLKNGLEQYLNAIFPIDVTGEPLKATSYRRYMKEKDINIEYVYPEADGFMCIKLEAFLWGMSRKRTLFVLGTTENGHHIRLRYYPRREYMGYPLHDCPYAHKDAYWFVGFRKSKDGAMDIVMALPLGSLKLEDNTCNEVSRTEQIGPKKTLLEQINCAYSRHAKKLHNT